MNIQGVPLIFFISILALSLMAFIFGMIQNRRRGDL